MILRTEEQIMQKLGALYEGFGYSRYKMSKFEEYDLYVRNRDSLVSDGVITFTDRNGKLLALKPDVTMSIIKNGSDCDGMQKVYYNENVYRVSKGTHSFKEIMQAGLECIGEVDGYCLYEVLTLARDSLKSITDEYVLDVSHLGITTEVIKMLPEGAKKEALSLIGDKNLHELYALCQREGVSSEETDRVIEFCSLRGSAAEVFPKLKALVPDSKYIDGFESTVSLISGNINIDFSVVDDTNYYNGILFKGYIRSIPSSVLSGGQYDVLMQKMGRRAKACGFAVYLDLLSRLDDSTEQYDADAVILYDESCSIKDITTAAKEASKQYKRVCALKEIPKNYKYKQLLNIKLEIIEENA